MRTTAFSSWSTEVTSCRFLISWFSAVDVPFHTRREPVGAWLTWISHSSSQPFWRHSLVTVTSAARSSRLTSTFGAGATGFVFGVLRTGPAHARGSKITSRSKYAPGEARSKEFSDHSHLIVARPPPVGSARKPVTASGRTGP